MNNCKQACPSDCTKACRHIQSLGFMMDELRLFLDTHPCDVDALKCFEHYQCEYNKQSTALEGVLGPINTTSQPVSGDSWKWVETPFPWELSGC